MANCAYCGGYIKESGNTQMFKSLGKSLGLEIVGDAIGGAAKLAGHKKYCSQKCKEAAEGSGGNSNTGKNNEATGQITRAINDAAISTKKDGMQAVMDISFDGDTAAIVNAISNLFTIAAANIPGGVLSGAAHKEMNLAKKGIRAAAIEKIELGIVNLRSKGDTANAEYFQKKFDEIKPKKGLFGKK